jgi:hypothetical protein
MPKLNTFEIQIKTGASGCSDPPKFKINGFPLDFENPQGSVQAGDAFCGVGAPQSFSHSLVLCGPSSGKWDIEEATMTYDLGGEPPYTIRFGAVTLDEESDLNIWQERPAPTFDV